MYEYENRQTNLIPIWNSPPPPHLVAGHNNVTLLHIIKDIEHIASAVSYTVVIVFIQSIEFNCNLQNNYVDGQTTAPTSLKLNAELANF